MERTRLKILLVGVFTYGSTDLWKKLALERLGHRVVCAPYRDRPVEEHFPLGEPFDVVFVSKGVPLTSEQFQHLATLGKHRLLWWPDPIDNWDEAHSAAMRTGDWALAATSWNVLAKIVGTAGRVEVPSWEKLPPLSRLYGAPLTRILEGCDCEGPRVEWTPKDINPSLLHFGTMTPRRKAIIERVRAAGIAVQVLDGPLYGSALQRVVLAHAAVLGINSSADLYSNRLQTVVAMGGAILQEQTTPPSLDLDELPFTTPGPIGFWTENGPDDRSLEKFAQERVMNPLSYRRTDDAVEVYDKLCWERVMERALKFATQS